MNNIIWQLLPISLFISVAAIIGYLGHNKLISGLFENPVVFIVSALMIILPSIVAIELRIRADRQDERLLAIGDKAASLTLYQFIGSMFVVAVAMQSRGIHTIEINLMYAPFIAIAWIGTIYCLCFIGYYYKMS